MLARVPVKVSQRKQEVPTNQSLMETSANENVRTMKSLVAHIYMNAAGKVVVKSGVIT